MPYVPRTSYGRDSLGYRGDANKLFLTFLFCDRNIGIQFRKDVGLIRSKMLCNACGRDMTYYPILLKQIVSGDSAVGWLLEPGALHRGS